MAKIKRKLVTAFHESHPQLRDFLATMVELAKKRPNDPVSKFKLKHINEVLDKVNEILGTGYRPFKDFLLFELEAELPTSSDVVMMLTQYLSRMEKFRSEHTVAIYDEHYPGMNVLKENQWDIGD